MAIDYGAKRKVKVNIDGKERSAVLLDFITEREDWNRYVVEDGTVVRLRLLVSQVARVVEDSGAPAFNDQGGPLVNVQYAVVLDVGPVEAKGS